MSRAQKILGLLLGLQLLLVAAVFWPRTDDAEHTAGLALLTLDATAIDRISISDSEDSILLARTGALWQMPEYHNLPVDTEKLSRVLLQLPALPRGWPITSSSGALPRFALADDNYQRKVNYYRDANNQGGLYVGTAPGFRKVHTRIEGDNTVYAVAFNAYELPVLAEEWLRKDLLAVEGVQAIHGLDFQISREGELWAGAEGQALDQVEVEKLLNALRGLRVIAATDIATAAIFEEMNAPATLLLETASGSFELRLYEMEETYYIQRADIPVYFTLSDYDYNRLADVSAATLYPMAEAGREAGSED